MAEYPPIVTFDEEQAGTPSLASSVVAEDGMHSFHPHHPLRYILVIGFIAMILLSSEKAGQSEMVRVAAEQTMLYSVSRAPVAEDTANAITEPVPIDLPDEPVSGSSIARIPIPLRGIYLTGWSAGNQKTVDRILSLIDRTEINAVIVDIKDASGKLSYQPLDPLLFESGVGTNRIKDMPALAKLLHERGIYLIGRVAVFQDPFYSLRHPEDAFHDSRTGGLWRDYKGISWLRPDSTQVWEYLLSIVHDAKEEGFDEVNVDYVRFPSDGELSFLEGRGNSEHREETIESFFSYIGPRIKKDDVVLSADLFGLTMSASDDLGIGQRLERIAPHVDVVAPMVYPSHFAAGAYGIADPAAYPRDIIRSSLSRGIKKLEAVGIAKEKLRPWLQDFDLGAVYTPDMVRGQIEESEALGLASWMLWDPRNMYTEAALLTDSVK